MTQTTRTRDPATRTRDQATRTLIRARNSTNSAGSVSLNGSGTKGLFVWGQRHRWPFVVDAWVRGRGTQSVNPLALKPPLCEGQTLPYHGAASKWATQKRVQPLRRLCMRTLCFLGLSRFRSAIQCLVAPLLADVGNLTRLINYPWRLISVGGN